MLQNRSPDPGQQPGRTQGHNNHIWAVREIVMEAFSGAIGSLIATHLAAHKKPSLLHYRTAEGTARSFLLPMVLGGFKAADLPVPQINLLEVGDTSEAPKGQFSSAADLERGIKRWRTEAVSKGRRLLSGAAGADVLYFDSLLASGGFSHAREELDAALSLVKPGGSLIYVQDSLCPESAKGIALPPAGFLAQGEHRMAFLEEAKQSIIRCMNNAADHLSSKVATYDWGEVFETCEVPTEALQKRLQPLRPLQAPQGDVTVIFTRAGMGCVERTEPGFTPGMSNVSYNGFVLFAQKRE